MEDLLTLLKWAALREQNNFFVWSLRTPAPLLHNTSWFTPPFQLYWLKMCFVSGYDETACTSSDHPWFTTSHPLEEWNTDSTCLVYYYLMWSGANHQNSLTIHASLVHVVHLCVKWVVQNHLTAQRSRKQKVLVERHNIYDMYFILNLFFVFFWQSFFIYRQLHTNLLLSCNKKEVFTRLKFHKCVSILWFDHFSSLRKK